ncbi:TetR/AcrR family transcriptional regulator [Cellulomonas carbonis]|uniref:TetR family transcriptional regulator n=1 Tax=Cellulomonas carbonis T26 TaxID=947969 RepID=A0A0A0BQ26_9CELL|nr:TetR family transcriptional regulator [Cellulomonas carbonis]KGM09722.1 TetR family transcriptional regulator [Cellulomonas carbonis T26]GGC00054.1 TetR family transcriptional regulator [Cellulomonas carbonis]
MRSAGRSRESSVEDLTTRARIRDVAVLRFGRDGFGASVRTVAADAGVSPALVIHHFGTKERLREACDAHVLQEIRHAKRESLVEASGNRFLEYLATAEHYAPVFAYVMRSLQHGGPLAKAFVDHMVEDAVAYLADGVAAGVIVPSRDEEARARYLVLSALGAGLLSMALDPPDDPADVAAMMRRHFDAITLPALELYTEGMLTSRRMLDEYLLYVSDPPGAREDAS